MGHYLDQYERDVELAEAERNLRKTIQSLLWVGGFLSEVEKLQEVLETLKENRV